MARIGFFGWDLGSTVAGYEWKSITGAATSVVSGASARLSRGYAGRINGLTTGVRHGWGYQNANSSGNLRWFIRFYFKIATVPSAENRFFFVTNGDGVHSGAQLVWLTVDASRQLRLYDEDGQIASVDGVGNGVSAALSLDTWYRIEVQVDRLSATAGTSKVRARIDGTDFAGLDNRSLGAGLRAFFLGGNLGQEANTAGDWVFDDGVFNDSSGSVQNSYPGEGKVIILRPNGAGASTQWTPSVGSNWQCVDEVTPNDATDYVSSNTDEQIDSYALDPSDLTSETITCIGLNLRGRGQQPTDVNAWITMRVTAGGATEEANGWKYFNNAWAASGRSSNSWNPILVLYDLPGSSTSPWTPSDLDSAEIGLRVTDVGTGGADISALWMLVDYVPSAGGPTTYNVNVSGALTPGGGNPRKMDSARYFSSVSDTGALIRRDAAGFLSSVSETGGMVRSGRFTEQAGIVASGAVVKRDFWSALSGLLPSGGTRIAVVLQGIGGAIGAAGSLLRRTNLVRSGSVSPLGSLASELVSGAQTHFLNVAGTAGMSGTLLRFTRRLQAGGTSPMGSVVRSVVFRRSGGISGAGNAAISPRLSRGSQNSPAGAAIRRLSRAFSGGANPSGSVGIQATIMRFASVSGVVGVSGALRTLASLVRGGQVSPLGDRTSRKAGASFGNVTPSSALTRRTARTQGGIVSLSGIAAIFRGAVTRLIELASAVGASGSAIFRTNLVRSGQSSPVGSAIRSARQRFAGVVSWSGIGYVIVSGQALVRFAGGAIFTESGRAAVFQEVRERAATFLEGLAGLGE